MDIEQRESGLIVPRTKPEKPARTLGPMEVVGDERRAATVKAMVGLWRAMELERSGAAILPGTNSLEEQRDLWWFFAKLVLGPDAPSMEIKT